MENPKTTQVPYIQKDILQTQTSQRIGLLKDTVERILNDREKIPHELFWSLLVGEFQKLQSERKKNFADRIKKIS